MSIDYDKLFELVVFILSNAFPFALIFLIAGKLVNSFLSMVNGDNKVRL